MKAETLMVWDRLELARVMATQLADPEYLLEAFPVIAEAGDSEPPRGWNPELHQRLVNFRFDTFCNFASISSEVEAIMYADLNYVILCYPYFKVFSLNLFVYNG